MSSEKIMEAFGKFLLFVRDWKRLLPRMYVKEEDNQFEQSKITHVSTKTSALNLYLDSFGIEKVRLQGALYDKNLPADKRSITAYIEFEELTVLAEDVSSGRLFKKIQESGASGYRLGYKGSKNSKAYGGKPESRYISFGMSGDKVFVNLIRCQGVETQTGGIAPDDKRDKSTDLKISVGMSVDKFRSMILYTHDCVNAFLVGYINANYMKARKTAFDEADKKKNE